MMKFAVTSPRLLVITGALGLAALIGGVAYAAIPSSDGSINGCYLKVSGLLRVIDSSKGQKCTKVEVPINWDQQGAVGAQGPKGDTGATGAPGPAGANGAPGADGTNGMDGVNGIDGSDGTNGTDGRTVLNGAGSPQDAGATGATGDFYIDTENHVIYGPKTASGWPATGTSLLGPQGPTGADGTDGMDGRTILNGAGSPQDTGAAGATGDFYIDTENHVIYGPKTASGWPATGTSLVGPAGTAGGAGFTPVAFTAPGNYTYTVPGDSATTVVLDVELKGGGGGGGIETGGGEGGYVKAMVTAAGGTICVVTVGSGGQGLGLAPGGSSSIACPSVEASANGGDHGRVGSAGGTGDGGGGGGVAVVFIGRGQTVFGLAGGGSGQEFGAGGPAQALNRDGTGGMARISPSTAG